MGGMASSDPSVHHPGPSSLATALLFGCIAFATAALATRTWLAGDCRAIRTSWGATKAHPLDLSSYTSLYVLLSQLTVFGFILLFAYVCEFHPPFPHSEKSYDRDEFLFMTAVLFVVSAYTVQRNDGLPMGSGGGGGGDGATLASPPSSVDRRRGGGGGHHRHHNRDGKHHNGHGHHHNDKRGGHHHGHHERHHRRLGHHDEAMGAGAPSPSPSPSAMDSSGEEAGESSGMEDINLTDDDVTKLIGGGGGGGGHGNGGGRGGHAPQRRSGSVSPSPRSSSAAAKSTAMATSSHSTGGAYFGGGGGKQHDPHGGDDRSASSKTKKSGGGGAAKPVPVVGVVADVKACDDVLNRDQTEEWKGWMQFMFLLYHYYHAEEMYNAIRVMITSYVWMTGFGNFSFFYLKDDYGAVRVMQMLWRLNFLVLFLCMSQGTTYILYYICPLHTYFFLMVYCTMRLGRHLNYSRYGLRFKLLAVAMVIYLTWDVDTGIFRLLHFPFLGTYPEVGATAGAMWEWYFRSTLDHWSTFLGMIFAANFPIISLFYRKLECRPWHEMVAAKAVIGAAMLSAFYLWVTGPFQEQKLQYNATNSYFGFIPLITYIYFRNLTPTLRSHSLNLLHQIGKTTLETYLMQHHIWLTSDAKSLLTFIPGWPKVNMVLVTCIYYLVSRRLYRLTLFLRAMLLPDRDVRRCYQSLGTLALVLVVFYAIAYSMISIHTASLYTVLLVMMLGGMLLYQTVLDMSWAKYRDSAPPPDDADPMEPSRKVDNDSPVARLSPPLIGTMVLFILGLFWEGVTVNGAGKILPLPHTCEAQVNTGSWVPVDGCNEYQRGVGYRDHGTLGYASCGGSYVWGWDRSPSNSHCRFTHRSESQLIKALNHRRMVFIGDSMTRNVFHAFCRSMGDTDAGKYDATVPKHSDITKTIGKTRMEFKWAPLAVDEVGKLREVHELALGGGGGGDGGQQQQQRPDAVVVGGGAWDRLHVWATDEDQKSLRSTLKELAVEMADCRSDGLPTVWLNPTTINTPALFNEDKREHMKEEDMEEMRDLHAQLGVWAASTFVLDGTAFTKDRVGESYDGVHYPASVYDAGAQILANALDWVLLNRDDVVDTFVPPQPGTMANPFLGLMMLCIIFIGLFFFDGFFGFSYLGSIFVSGVMPNDLYEEAFTPLHQKMKLPPVAPSATQVQGRGDSGGNDEIVGLLGSGRDLELART